jgi:small subunit ribosomal protein S4
MARYTGPVCKLCRREGLKLFLKGSKCATERCTFNERKNPPGPPPKRRPKLSAFATQLREKQKVKRIYGVLEKPFRNYFSTAQRMSGIAGENLLILLERRLDNTLYRMGIASSRAQARNFISHGHVLVNTRKVDIPSYQVGVGDEISIMDSMKAGLVEQNVELARGMGFIPEWIDADDKGTSAKIIKNPVRDNIDIAIKEQVIVELYSK